MTCQSTDQKDVKSQNVSRQDTMQESAILKQMEPVLLNIKELGFLENGTGKHESNTVYESNGICPCEYAKQYKSPFKILE